jgi:hypothetical protein
VLKFAEPEYAKVGFGLIHWQRDNGNLSQSGESEAKRGFESLFRLRPILGALLYHCTLTLDLFFLVPRKLRTRRRLLKEVFDHLETSHS